MPQQLDSDALADMKEVSLPQARPPHQTQRMNPETGQYVYGKMVAGTKVDGPNPLPHIQIPVEEFPKVVYKHPFKAWVPRLVMIDGHGNKAWKWQANLHTSRVVGDAKELKTAMNQGFSEKPFITPPIPDEDPEAVALAPKAV